MITLLAGSRLVIVISCPGTWATPVIRHPAYARLVPAGRSIAETNIPSVSIWLTPPVPAVPRRIASVDRSELAPLGQGWSRFPRPAAAA